MDSYTGFTEFEMNEDLFRSYMPSEASSVATEFPVYRSVQIAAPSSFEGHLGLDSVVDIPHLAKPLLSKPLLDISISNESFTQSEFEDFEFFKSSTIPPSISDLGFCPLASTHLELTMGVGDVVQTISTYLATRDVSARFINSSFRWICEMEQDFEAIKFEIQIYTTISGVTIEFLRMRGSSMVFSKLFRDCKCALAEIPSKESIPLSPRGVACILTDDITSEACPVVEWIKNDPVEGVKVLCEMIRDRCIDLKKDADLVLVRDACIALVGSAPSLTVLPTLSLSKLLIHTHLKEGEITNIKVLLEILIPSVARNGCASGSSDFVKKQTAEVMESISRL